MAVPARLTVVTLGCRDVPAQRRFYRALGFREAPGSTDEWVVYPLSGTHLCLWGFDTLHAEAAPDRAPLGAEDWNGITLAINVASRDEVDQVHADALAAGATSVDPPTDRPYGPRAAYVADPEGNRWEIVWAPGTSIDDDGRLHGLGAG